MVVDKAAVKPPYPPSASHLEWHWETITNFYTTLMKKPFGPFCEWRGVEPLSPHTDHAGDASAITYLTLMKRSNLTNN